MRSLFLALLSTLPLLAAELSPLSLFKKQHPQHPALQLDLADHLPTLSYHAVTNATFLTSLTPAWLSHTGHKRPGIKPGLPLPEAQARAAQTLR